MAVLLVPFLFVVVAVIIVAAVLSWLTDPLDGAQEYRYLQRSVAAFPPAVEFAELMRESGLADVRFDRLTFGAAHLYVGVAGGNPTTV